MNADFQDYYKHEYEGKHFEGHKFFFVIHLFYLRSSA